MVFFYDIVLCTACVVKSLITLLRDKKKVLVRTTHLTFFYYLILYMDTCIIKEPTSDGSQVMCGWGADERSIQTTKRRIYVCCSFNSSPWDNKIVILLILFEHF